MADLWHRRKQAPATASNHLYELDKSTQSILSSIQEYQRAHPGEGGGTVTVTLSSSSSSTKNQALKSELNTTQEQEQQQPCTSTLNLPANPISFAHLQRLRRQFVSLHRQQMGAVGSGAVGAGGGGLDAMRVGALFVDWLNERFGE